MDRSLPHPTTIADEYLAALHADMAAVREVLGEIRDRLPALTSAEGGQPTPGDGPAPVELAEPGAAAEPPAESADAAPSPARRTPPKKTTTKRAGAKET